jgi:hypothetical protein
VLGAVKHSILCAIWHMLATGELYRDLGGDYFHKRDPERQTNRSSNRSKRSATTSHCSKRPQPERYLPVRSMARRRLRPAKVASTALTTTIDGGASKVCQARHLLMRHVQQIDRRSLHRTRMRVKPNNCHRLRGRARA